MPGQTGYGASGQSAYGAPTYGAPGQTPYGASGQTGYGTSGQSPSGTLGQPYGASAAPSQGRYPPQAGYAPPPGYAPVSTGLAPRGGYAPGWAGSPYAPGIGVAAPPKKRRGKVAGIASGVIGTLVALACIGGRIFVASQAGTNPVPAGPPTADASSSYTSTLTSLGATGWANDSHCSAKSDGFHVVGGYVCNAPVSAVTDLDITVQVKQITGTDLAPYGIAFRLSDTSGNVGDDYEFDVDGNGKWVFGKFIGGKETPIVDFTANKAIKKGLNVTNGLEVKARGSLFTFYVNGVDVGHTTDSTITTAGKCGLAGNDGIEVVYTNFSLTRL